MIYISEHLSPFGKLILGASDSSLFFCDWKARKDSDRFISRIIKSLNDDILVASNALIHKAITLLDGYFSGAVPEWNIPLFFDGSDFQKKVWNEISNVSYGNTTSYSRLAFKCGCHSAVRAVANAVGANRFSIIIPCHRIVGKNNIGGYAGGLQVKQSLLNLENSIKK